jgi:hypothetical protein
MPLPAGMQHLMMRALFTEITLPPATLRVGWWWWWWGGVREWVSEQVGRGLVMLQSCTGVAARGAGKHACT